LLVKSSELDKSRDSFSFRVLASTTMSCKNLAHTEFLQRPAGLSKCCNVLDGIYDDRVLAIVSQEGVTSPAHPPHPSPLNAPPPTAETLSVTNHASPTVASVGGASLAGESSFAESSFFAESIFELFCTSLADSCGGSFCIK